MNLKKHNPMKPQQLYHTDGVLPLPFRAILLRVNT